MIETSTTSAADGSWSMSLTSGYTYTLIASKSGYYSRTSSVYVPPTGGGSCNFVLESTSGVIDTGVDTGGASSGCLATGTKIATPDGEVSVEDIKEGDIVLSYDEQTGIVEPNIVYYTTVHSDYAGYLQINDRLRITANHPVYTTEGIVDAGDLSVGNVMKTIAGTEVVTSIVKMPELATLYNFEVADNHNYFAEGVLVHNVCTLKFGCPFIYGWNGDEYVEENNILPQSTKPDRSQLDVSDCYLLQNEVQPVNGSYSFLLYEPALEKTHLDEVQLAIIDYDANLSMAITPQGAVKTIDGPQAPVSCMDDWGCEVVELVDENDDGYQIKVEHNETLTLQFGQVGEVDEVKLVIAHKAIMELLPYAVPIDPRYYKCSIHVQTMDELGEWHDFASVPARLNGVIDVVDVTAMKSIINQGGPIRLLITGTHIIDFIGLDVSGGQELEIEYFHPSYASYYNNSDSIDFTSQLMHQDQSYATLSPKQCIELLFPYKEQIKEHRALAFISSGHYYTLSEIDIEQPVQVKAAVLGGTGGVVSLTLNEVTYGDSARELTGIRSSISTWPDNETVITFVQNTREQYALSARFEGCNEKTVIICEVTSFRGSMTCYFRYDPTMGSNATITQPLDDVLWNVTGATFDKLANRFIVLKDTMLQFDLNEYYGYDTSTWNNFTWNFGDGLWTGDLRPTHEYEAFGVYILNLSVMNSDTGMFFYSDTRIEVVSSAPIPVPEIYQEVVLTLTVAGRKGNTVGVRVYEDGALVDSIDVIRTSGQPDSASILLKKHLGSVYRIELVYDAVYKGLNPTWLEFRSGGTKLAFFEEFNTCHGYDQIVTVPSSYLTEVTEKNPVYHFDATESYDIDGEIVSYLWDFGDGATSNVSMAEHRYTHNGVYIVSLTVTDDDGLVTTVEREIDVIAFRPPSRRCGLR